MALSKRKTLRELVDVNIAAVVQFGSYKGCLMCKARAESTDPPLCRCSKCNMLQRMDKCPDQLSAKLIVDSNGHSTQSCLE